MAVKLAAIIERESRRVAPPPKAGGNWGGFWNNSQDGFRGFSELLDAAPNVALAPAPLKVLYVSTPSVFSGAEQSLCQLVAHLDADRVKPYALVAMRGVFTERLERAGAEVICPERNLAADTVNNFLYALNVFKRIKPDVIHFNCASGTPALFAAAVTGVPIIQHVRVAELQQYGEHLRNADGIIEAMAMGLPVVATASGGNRELLTDGETGFVVPAGDPAALAARLEEVLTRPDLTRRATQAARAFAEAELSARLCAGRVTDLYERLTYGRAGRLRTALA
ncbi:MAG: glycosyltransferase [Pyrinomonadaceae bacterium]